MTGFLSAVAFLTRVPVGREPRDLHRAPPWFPAVGALVALVSAGVYALAYRFLPSPLAAVLAVVAGILLTGAFHEDGLADSSDALGSGATGEDAIAIMRDSRLGTYGTTAVVVSVLWRVLALGSLSPSWALGALVMAHSLGRGAVVVLMWSTPPARTEGLGRAGRLEITGGGVLVSSLSALAIATAVGGIWAVPAALIALAAAGVVRRLALKRIGGVSGDLLGACEQVGEMGGLTVAAAAAWGGAVPWWAG